MIIKPKRIIGSPHDTKKFRSFELEDYITPISTEVYGARRRVSIKVQLDHISRFTKSLKKKGANPVLCIGGQYSDMRPMQVATHLVPEHALWHRVIGGFYDNILETRPKASVLVISNIVGASTPHKLEKVRDLLDTYDTIPRVVCVGGVDPLKFFGESLHYKLNCSLYLTTAR